MSIHPLQLGMLPALHLLALALLFAGSAADAADDLVRPRIGLVLSGGGARGFAHVGVLRALRDMRVPIDMVIGVSMGAVVGGAYAAGRSVDELEEFVRGTDWSSIVADRPPRDDLAFRRREDDLLLPARIEFGIGWSGPRMPPATAANGALEAVLARLLPPGAGELPVNRLGLPFRTAASDLLTGELVVLSDTPLFTSLRASLSVPGVFAPVRVNQRLLIDGGLVRNLPVDLARAMGADIIIAVNVGTPLTGEEAELGSALKVAQQMLQILTEQNVQRSLKELGPQDVLISPDLTGVTFLNFSRVERAVSDGEQAAQLMSAQLSRLAVSPEAYAAHEAARRRLPQVEDTALPLARLTVPATPHASSEALAAQSGLHEGELVTEARAQQAAAKLFGRGDFERVEVSVQDSPEGREVTLKPFEAAWARSRLRLGLELVSDSSDDNRFTVSALHLLSWVNSWGAELRTLARVGSERSLSTQFWQPLAPGSDFYVAPSLQYKASSIDIYEQERRTLRVGYAYRTAGLAFGRQLSNWGNLQLGLERRVGRSRSLVDAGAPLSDAHFAESAYYVQVQVDTLDSLALPSRGVLIQSRWERSAGEDDNGRHATFSIETLKAFRFGDWSGHVWGEWARARDGLAPLSLGGFLRLSGTPRESVGGRSVGFTRLVMARRIGDMPTGLGGAVRTGFSLELGGGYDTAFRDGEMKRAGSGFVAVDTRFGPVFLALGATRGMGSTLYLFLGPFW